MLEKYIQALPTDLQRNIYNITLDLRKPKTVISEKLKFQIHHHRGIFYKILACLHEEQSNLMHVRYKSYSYLAYKMVFVLNEYIYTENCIVSDNVRRVFDGLSDDEISEYNSIDTYLIYDEQSMFNVIRFITKCWSIMNCKQRMQLMALQT